MEGTEIRDFLITHQGEKALELSGWRQLWLARIKRKNPRPDQYPNTQLCSDQFVSGLPSALFDGLQTGLLLSDMILKAWIVLTPNLEGMHERAVERSRKRAIA